MKKRISAFATACLIFTLANTASAHVTISPKESNTGAFEHYNLLAPAEKDSNFTKLRVEVPTRVKLMLIEPIAGWNYELEKDTNGNTKAITWTATAGGIKKGEFTEFSFVGENTKEASTVTWKAVQSFADGSVAEWTGEPDSKSPAPSVNIKQPATAVDHHGNALKPGETDKGHDDAASADHATANESTTGTSDTLPLILSGGSLLLSLIALFAIFRKRA